MSLAKEITFNKKVAVNIFVFSLFAGAAIAAIYYLFVK